MKKFIAAFVGIAFLFSTVSAPLVEANFWKERRDAARTKNSTGQGVQYAMAPGAQGALADALPLVGSFDSAAAGSTGGGQAHLLAARSVLSTEQIKLMPAWLNTISSAHGSISAAYFAPNAADRPLVVHIQDVHEQREAQMNISGLISELVNTGAVSLVGLEGATGAFDLVPYRTFPNKAVIGDVADFFLQEHLIGGGEHAGWTMEKEPTLWGIEEVNVYLKNLNSFKDSLPIQQRVQDRIKSWEYRLAQAKPKVYSPALKSFDEAQARYRTDSMPLPDFVALMEKSVKIEDKKYPAMAAFKKCLAMEKGLDFADVERERARLIESLTKALSEKEISALVQRTLLYKSGHLTYGGYYDSLQTICETRGVSLSRFPAMASYIKYVLASEQIKPEALLEELDMVQDQAASTLVRSADERAVYELAQDLHSLANLTAFKMAPRDWEIYQRTRDRIMNIAARMDQVAPGADNFKGDLPKDLVSFEGFCQAALKRDETLVNNLLAKMKETNQKTGLLLAGGFHTQGMTELLKKGKVSYVVFTPTLTDVSSDSHYLDFLKDRPALEKLFTQEKITTKAPINASVTSPTPGYDSAKASVAGLAETIVTAMSGGQVPPAVDKLSSVTVQKIGEGVYASQANKKRVSVSVGEGSENKSGLGKLVAFFSGKVSSFAIFVKDRGIASYLSPTALIAKVVDLFSGQNRPPSTEATQTRNFMKTGQLVRGGEKLSDQNNPYTSELSNDSVAGALPGVVRILRPLVSKLHGEDKSLQYTIRFYAPAVEALLFWGVFALLSMGLGYAPFFSPEMLSYKDPFTAVVGNFFGMGDISTSKLLLFGLLNLGFGFMHKEGYRPQSNEETDTFGFDETPQLLTVKEKFGLSLRMFVSHFSILGGGWLVLGGIVGHVAHNNLAPAFGWVAGALSAVGSNSIFGMTFLPKITSREKNAFSLVAKLAKSIQFENDRDQISQVQKDLKNPDPKKRAYSQSLEARDTIVRDAISALFARGLTSKEARKLLRVTAEMSVQEIRLAFGQDLSDLEIARSLRLLQYLALHDEGLQFSQHINRYDWASQALVQLGISKEPGAESLAHFPNISSRSAQPGQLLETAFGFGLTHMDPINMRDVGQRCPLAAGPEGLDDRKGENLVAKAPFHHTKVLAPNGPAFAYVGINEDSEIYNQLRTKWMGHFDGSFEEYVRSWFVRKSLEQRSSMERLLVFLQSHANSESQFAQFKGAYTQWVNAMAQNNWSAEAKPNVWEIFSFFEGIDQKSFEEVLENIRSTSNEMYGIMHRIDYSEGMAIKIPSGTLHAIAGLSLQVHPLHGPDDKPKDEAWIPVKVGEEFVLLEPQRASSDVTFSGADSFNPFKWGGSEVEMRKSMSDNDIKFAYAQAEMSGRPRNHFVIQGEESNEEVKPNVSKDSQWMKILGDPKKWAYFRTMRLEIKKDGGSSTIPFSSHTYKEVFVPRGSVTVTISRRGERRKYIVSPESPLFLPATLSVDEMTIASSSGAHIFVVERWSPAQRMASALASLNPGDPMDVQSYSRTYSVPTHKAQRELDALEGNGHLTKNQKQDGTIVYTRNSIAMGGMSYQDKEKKAAEIFGQLQTLQNNLDLGIIVNRELSRRVREIVSDLFNLQQDGNLGDVQHIANLVNNQLKGAGIRLDQVQRLFGRAFNIRYIRERQKNNDYGQGTHQSPSTLSELADTLNSSLKFIAEDNFIPNTGPNGRTHGPANRGEALAELRIRLYENLYKIQSGVNRSVNLSDSGRELVLDEQTLVLDALFILDLMERGVQGADRIRVTTNPEYQLTAENRAPSFLDRRTLPARVSTNENGIGAYNRGIETGKKMAADLTDLSGQAPRNLDAYILYAMRHGLVPVPQGLRSITKANGGTISTFHHTVFGMRNVPQALAAASTGVGHYQANQLDVKQVTRGEAIQVLVAYNEDGSVRDVLYQRAKAGEYLTALPGYYDYMITTGNEPVEFDDISINLSQLGFSAEQIAKFNGGVQPTNPPQKAPYVYVNGKLTPATGLSGQVPPIREIASVQAHQGASLFDIYGLLDESSLNLVAQSLVDRAGALVATTYRGRQPKPLAFGTSGLRGLVTEITDLEVYINTLGYLNYLQNQGQIKPGDTVVIARDFRDSSPRIAAAVAQAITNFGAQVVDLGRLSTPALTLWGIQNKVVSVMVTGSHIPFDRNGIKFNKASGEVVKADEPGINQHVGMARESQYREDPSDSLFDDEGNFKKTPVNRLNDVGADRAHDQPYVGKWTSASTNIPTDQRRQFSEGEEAYIQRYVSVYGSDALAGQYYSVYLHSGVGTRLFAEILRRLGANVYEFGPSDTFIAIDTEAISDETLGTISAMVGKIRMPRGATMTAVLSTDGDSDRPLVLGYNKMGGKTELDFIPGDIAGAFVAKKLGANAVAVPISANDAVDGYLGDVGISKTRIGSPYIVVGMESLAAANKGKRVVGWEANGGFLTGVEISHRQGILAPLPTRDAVLPMVEILVSAKKENSSISHLFKPLRSRVGKADLIDNFPVEASAAIVREFSLADIGVGRVVFSPDGKLKAWKVVDSAKGGNSLALDNSSATNIRTRLQNFFTKDLGFGEIDWIDFTDGIRIHFTNNDIAHIRPSGNAPQLRIYAVADSAERASEIVQNAIKEDGIYRRIQADLSSETAPQSVVGRFGPASSLLSVKAKPFSVARKLAYAVGFNVAAIVVVAYGLVAGYFFPLILLAMTLPYGLVAGGAFVAFSNLAQNEKGDINVLFDGIRRFSYDPTIVQGSNDVQVKIGKRNVTVKFGAPTGGRFNGNFRFAETTRESTKATITVHPGTPAWLLPIVLSQEIYRVDWWQGALSTLSFLVGLPEATYSSGWVIPQKRDQATSADTRGPPDQPTADMTRVVSIVLAGGASSRFWPLNKTLSELSGMGLTMIQATFHRVTEKIGGAFSSFIDIKNFFIVAGSDVETPLKKQLPEMPVDNLLIEPGRRNTLPAILFAMANARQRIPNATVTMLTADHIIPDTEQFRQTMDKAIALAQDPNANNIVTIGINPIDLETGEVASPADWTPFGAIEANTQSKVGVGYQIKLFTEKPSVTLAGQMVEEQRSGNATRYWNSGMLVFSIQSMEKALEKFQPELFAKYLQLVAAIQSGDMETARDVFNSFPSKIKHPTEDKQVDNSVDYALLVPMTLATDNSVVHGVVVPGSFEWIDIGSFDALRKVKSIPTDEHGNRRIGVGSTTGSKDTILVADSEREIYVEGLEDVAVVFSNAGQLLVLKTSLAQGVKNVKDAYDEGSDTPTVVWDSKMTIQPGGAGVTVTGADSQKVRVLGVENISITFEGNKVTVRNTNIFPTRSAGLSVSDEMVPAATAQRFGRERGVRVEPVQTPNTLPSFIRYSGEGTVAPPTARTAGNFDSLTADVFLRANAYWTDDELADFTKWARTSKNQATAQKIFLDVAFTLARLHGHDRTATGNYSPERQRNEMIALAVLADQMGMSDEARSNALDLYSREAAVQTIAARNNEDGQVADVQHQFMLAPVVRREDGTVGWDPAAGQEGINRWKKELRKVEEKTAVSLFLMSGDTSITPSELEEFLRAENVESRGPMQGTFFVHQGNYLTADGRIDFGGIISKLAPVHKTLASGSIAIVSMYENRFSFDNMPEGFSRGNLFVYIINMLGKLTQAGTSIETDVNSLMQSFIAA